MLDMLMRVLLMEVLRAWVWGVMLVGVSTYYLLLRRYLK
jgi:hypothetical protein